jgi:hypothetical protein
LVHFTVFPLKEEMERKFHPDEEIGGILLVVG